MPAAACGDARLVVNVKEETESSVALTFCQPGLGPRGCSNAAHAEEIPLQVVTLRHTTRSFVLS